MNFKEIEEQGLLLYKYTRGSHSHGTSTPESDMDEGGVFICPNEQLLGLGMDYKDEISDEKHDTCWWEFGKFMRLIMTSNPTVLEALFISDEFVIYEHPIISEIKKHRREFLTKECFMPFSGYAISQIAKVQGQNKYIHWDINEMKRKTILDFCYTFDENQGSKPIDEWLTKRGLRQDCCGLVNIPNMPGMYGVYYDFGQHLKISGIPHWSEIPERLMDYVKNSIDKTHGPVTGDNIEALMEWWWDEHVTPIGGYCGIMRPDGTSDQIRFSETPKYAQPICFMSYNENGYQSHCRKYKEYCSWKENRNKARYENNLQGIADEEEKRSKFYDSKNMAHCFRNIKMCIEIARGEEMHVNRRGIDSDFLLDVRHRKYTYDELMEKLKLLKSEMSEATENSTIPDKIDRVKLNEYLVACRKKFWETK